MNELVVLLILLAGVVLVCTLAITITEALFLWREYKVTNLIKKIFKR